MLLRVTFPLAAAHFVNQAARTVMAIVGPVLAVELGLSAVELGTLAACMFAAYAVTQLPLGVALDAFGARRVQGVLMALAALGFAIFALSPGFAGLALGRVLLGIGISAGLMAVLKGNADWFERSRVAQVIGISTAIAAVGSTVTTVPVQALLPTLGWRGVFWVLCGVTLAVALWIFLSVPDKIDVFVEELELGALGFAGVVPEATGRPAYHPDCQQVARAFGAFTALGEALARPCPE